MTRRCCLVGGYIHPDKLALLALLRQRGLEIPDGAEIWGRGHGYSWQVVSFTGWPLGVYGTASIADTVQAPGHVYRYGDDEVWVAPTALID